MSLKKEDVHPDFETPLEVPGGEPVTIEEFLKANGVDAEDMKYGTKTYVHFVAIQPMTMRTLLKDFDGGEGVKIEPFKHQGKSGSLLTTDHEEVFVRLCERFSQKPVEHEE